MARLELPNTKLTGPGGGSVLLGSKAGSVVGRHAPLVFLLASVVGVYSATLGGGFMLDDALFLTNENVTDSALWVHFLKLDGLRPLTYLSFHINHRLAGVDPRLYHATNLALHLLNVLLVFACLSRLLSTARGKDACAPENGQSSSQAQYAALTGAVFFALHPLQTETVNYVYQRSTLLGTAFGLLGLLALLRRPFRWSWALWALPALTAAGLSKESTVIWAPAWLLLLALAPGETTSRAWDAVRKLWPALVVLVAAAAVWSLWELEQVGDETLAFGADLSPWPYFLTQGRVLLVYLRLTVLPVGQSVDHDVAAVSGRTAAALWPLAVSGLLAVLCLGGALRRDLAALGLLVALLLLAPSSSLVPSNDLMFEHRLYLPYVGVSLAVAAAAARIRSPRLRGRNWVIPLLLGVWLVPWTWARNALWADPVALWTAAAESAPDKARPRLVLGSLLVEADAQRAITWLEQALERDPDNAEAWNNLGLARLRLGRPAEAERAWLEAVQRHPDYATGFGNLGGLAFASGRFSQAEQFYARVLELRPHDWRSYFNLGNARRRVEKTAEAETLYRQALEKNPRAIHVLNNLGALLRGRGDDQQAEVLFRQAIALDPDYLDARLNLAHLLAGRDQRAEALAELEELRRRDTTNRFGARVSELLSRLAGAR